MFYPRFPLPPGNADHVKPCIALLEPFLVQEKLCGLNNLALLSWRYRLKRLPKAMPRPSFDFDKNDNAPIQSDQVDLSDRTPIVPLYKPVSFFDEVPFGDLFPFPAKSLLRISQL